MPGNTEHTEARLPAENRRREGIGQALGDCVRTGTKASNNCASSYKFLVALGRGLNVQVNGRIGPSGDRRRGSETAERSREPVAEASRVSLRAVCRTCRDAKSEKQQRKHLAPVNMACRDHDGLATIEGHMVRPLPATRMTTQSGR